MNKAFAVSSEAISRSNAYGPRSAGWTLYDPRVLADRLGLPVAVIDRALEETGYHKAVRIREELIRWKERLRAENADITAEFKVLAERKRALQQRNKEVQEQLRNVRNLLRISREAPVAQPVEQLTRNEPVVSSILAGGSKS